MQEEDTKKELEILKNSYLMYEQTKAETERVYKSKNKGAELDSSTKKTIKLMNNMQNDVVEKYVMLGGKEEDLRSMDLKSAAKPEKKSRKKKVSVDSISGEVTENTKNDGNGNLEELKQAINEFRDKNKVSDDEKVEYEDFFLGENGLYPPISEMGIPGEEQPVQKKREKKPKVEEKPDNTSYSPDFKIDIKKAQGNSVKYDFIPLPSQGKCYKEKFNKIPVGYLTAYDENLIMSPNLYQDGTFLDHLVRNKVLDDNVDTDCLIPADREAILVWLRIGGYGNIYPVTATDKETGKTFNADVDLTKLKYKKFSLIPDENGHFTFKLPVGGQVVKFKYLTYKDTKELTEQTIKEDATLKKMKLDEISGSIEFYMEEETTNNIASKKKVDKIVELIRELNDSIDDSNYDFFNHLVTNRLSKSIVSVDGVTDRRVVDEFIENMPIQDAKSLREYIAENEPGFDLNIEVEKPESLGGGSMKLFLAFDQYMFLNTQK